MIKTLYIETSKGSFVKRNEDLGVDFVSPLPCPFNYGHIKGEVGGDGDPLDGVLLGATQPSGVEISARVVGCVRFLDSGEVDDKWILKEHGSITKGEKIVLWSFFHSYALLKRLSAPIRGASGQSKVLGIEYTQQ